MLVFGRRADEEIVINDDIVITIVAIKGDAVKIGIEAPRDVPVHRREVYDAIKKSPKIVDKPDKCREQAIEIERLKEVVRNIANGGNWSPTTLQEAIGDL